MRPISAARQTELEAGRACRAVRFHLRDGTAFGVCNHTRPLTIDGVVYEPASGDWRAPLRSYIDTAVDNLQLSGGWGDYNEQSLIEGLFNECYIVAGIAFWKLSPPEFMTTFRGDMGKLQWSRDGFQFQAEDIMQKLSRPLGRTAGPDCQVELGSTGVGQCNVDLSLYEVSGTVTAVDGSHPRVTFTDSGLTQTVPYWTDGLITWDTGDNAGLSYTVEAHAAGGELTLQLPARRAISIGDTFTITPGCDHTDGAGGCDKFGNRPNYQGLPFVRPETQIAGES
ncbi:DUF2163 domain-containing protein [Thioalbus denitrificans]|uniref:Putative phage protein (TIGR02218 family) n=1 Tax=Thioalbus denitrificans TaxID=547122 RepID=A0A369CJR1_9GAMM|nr:DUF2163 domain-containing protein [Thioalbus denitrificans]RCX32084.1 putative phage protein (TIGR02218 family) [Thioalbus denitrificans]